MYPSFLCIGAPKSGTTWLFDNLRRHSEVWLPKYKSVQYFSGKAASVRRKKLRRLWRTEVLKNVSVRQTMWDLNYFFHRQIDDRWYASLFEPGRNHKAVGEIAPSYTTLDEPQVARVAQLMPNTKILLLLRNPVERLWSHAVHTLVRNTDRAIGQVSEQELRDFFSSETMVKHTDYLRAIRLWSEAFGQEQVFVGFFDDISSDPGGLLTSICQFLKIDPDLGQFQLTKDRNIFKGLGHQMPSHLQRDLYEQYAGQIGELTTRFGGPTHQWLEKCEQALATDAKAA